MREFGSILGRNSIARLSVIMLALAASSLAGCGDKKNPVNSGPSGSTALTGLFINGFEGGKITLSVSSAALSAPMRAASVGQAVVNATGMMTFSIGGSIALAGTYDTGRDSLHVSGTGAGGTYTFDGLLDTTGDPDEISGSFTGPHGGGFFGCVFGGSSAVQVYCGDFSSNTTARTGQLDVLVTGSTLSGALVPDGTTADLVRFEGAVSGSGPTRSLTFQGSGGGFTLTGDGTLDTRSYEMNGTWTLVDNVAMTTDSGDWLGALCP